MGAAAQAARAVARVSSLLALGFSDNPKAGGPGPAIALPILSRHSASWKQVFGAGATVSFASVSRRNTGARDRHYM